jgi:hypothetical protein
MSSLAHVKKVLSPTTSSTISKKLMSDEKKRKAEESLTTLFVLERIWSPNSKNKKMDDV